MNLSKTPKTLNRLLIRKIRTNNLTDHSQKFLTINSNRKLVFGVPGVLPVPYVRCSYEVFQFCLAIPQQLFTFVGRERQGRRILLKNTMAYANAQIQTASWNKQINGCVHTFVFTRFIIHCWSQHQKQISHPG